MPSINLNERDIHDNGKQDNGKHTSKGVGTCNITWLLQAAKLKTMINLTGKLIEVWPKL